MKKDKTILYAIEILLIIFAICFVVFPNIFTKKYIAIILFIILLITNKFVKSDKLKGRYKKELTKLLIMFALVYVCIIYVLGIYIGFQNSLIKFSSWSLLNFIIPYIAIIIFTENIRKTILLKNDKKSNILITIAIVILNVALASNIHNVNTLLDYFTLIGLVMFSAIANNLLFNYIILKHRNCRAIIGYRIVTTIYSYFIPIIPNIHLLLESIIKIIVPYLIYIFLEANYGKKEVNFSRRKQTTDIVIASVAIILSAGILMLVSCKFQYGAIVIGSGSMTGTINKGDVIVYEVYDKEKEEVEIGDVIVFLDEEIRIVHRVINKNNTGNGMRYFTKGDANVDEDAGYRTDEDIVGKVKFRVPYLGQITVMINEMFK